MKVKIVKVPFKAQEGISIPVTSGEDSVNPIAELEEGEVYKSQDGMIKKIDDDAGTHEEGGVLVDDAHKVIEDTGDKRDDEVSKELLMSPDEVFQVTGFRPKRKVTHSKAYELAVNHYDKKVKSIEKKIKTGLKYAKDYNSKASENSMDLNLQLLESIPTKNDLFEAIFGHQEDIKEEKGIKNSDDDAQIGNNFPKINPAEADFSMDLNFMKQYPNPVQPSAVQKSNLQDAIERGIIEPPVKQYTTRVDVNEKPKGITPSTFNEPLQWYDVMQPLYSILNSRKEPVRFATPKVFIPSFRLLDPRPALEAGEASFNRAAAMLPSTTVGMANLANLFSQKYMMDNQIIGQYENQNKQILNQQDAESAKLKTMQSASDVDAIDKFELKRLTRDEAFRQQRMEDIGNISQKYALNRRFNREGQYLLNMFPHFDQTATYNQNPFTFTNPGTNLSSSNQTEDGMQVQMFTDPNTGQQVPFVALPTGKGGVTWKRLSFNRNQNWVNTK